jgi:hypothetical protein
VTEVQAYLEHSKPNTTLRVYAHWFKNVKTDSVQRLSESVLSGKLDTFGHQNLAEAGAGGVSARSGVAGVVELADTQDLKSCGGFPRTGSIPVPGIDFSAA